jgi:hypothetical protein
MPAIKFRPWRGLQRGVLPYARIREDSVDILLADPPFPPTGPSPPPQNEVARPLACHAPMPGALLPEVANKCRPPQPPACFAAGDKHLESTMRFPRSRVRSVSAPILLAAAKPGLSRPSSDLQNQRGPTTPKPLRLDCEDQQAPLANSLGLGVGLRQGQGTRLSPYCRGPLPRVTPPPRLWPELLSFRLETAGGFRRRKQTSATTDAGERVQ